MASSTKKRQAVAQGGMFSTPKVTFSKETRELLKVMMEESKLTNFQQRQLKQTISNGQCLPLQCNPTSSVPGKSQHTHYGRRKPGAKSCTPSRKGLRSKDTIDKLVVSSNEENYKPHPTGYNSTKEKKKLQNLMAYGKDVEPTQMHPVAQPLEVDEEEIDRFEEVLGEIEERREFLEDMAALGQDQPHRNRIMTEISQRIRELEEIDKDRCKEFKQSLGT